MLKLKIKELLEARGMSQSALSRKADVSLNTIQAIHHKPHAGGVKLSTLERLSRALDCTIGDLYEVSE